MDLQRRFIQRSSDDRSFGNNVFLRIVTQYDYNKLARHMNPELQEVRTIEATLTCVLGTHQNLDQVIERSELEIKMPKLM